MAKEFCHHGGIFEVLQSRVSPIMVLCGIDRVRSAIGGLGGMLDISRGASVVSFCLGLPKDNTPAQAFSMIESTVSGTRNSFCLG